MCGIAGLLGVDPAVARPAAERMLAAVRHRGPDDEGIESISRAGHQAPAVLAHARLSIFDLSPGGHQPMADGLGGTATPNWVTYNGEIYNFKELVPELESAGFPCRTRSDTEVLLKGYRAWGVRAVERFEGMFAFCLLDIERGTAWLCRDRLGIKPLYLYRPATGGLLFASEVRALLACGSALVPPRLRRSALESYLAQGAVMGEDAIIEGVRMLAPGESLLCDFEGHPIRSVRYWSVAFGRDAGSQRRPADGTPPSVDDWARAGDARPALWRTEVVTELGIGVRRAVRSQLLADVPVGLFLSSGIDSGAIAAVASEGNGRPLRTLAVGFDVPEFDESEAARRTAVELGTDHTHVALTGDEVLASFESVLGALDQPTVDGFNTFFVSRAAREAGLTVALSGLGGDELFGGYATFRDVPRALQLVRAARSFGCYGADALSRVVSRLGAWDSPARGRAWLKLAATLKRPADLVSLYFLRRELFPVANRRALHPLPLGSDALSGVDETLADALRFGHAGQETADQVAFFELSSYMRHMLLRDTDVLSMAHGLEVRVPLLEHYVVEQAARAKGSWRRPDPRPKPLLVDAAGARLPERAWRAKKRGFTFPWLRWLSGPLRPRVEAALAGSGLANVGLDVRAARSLWRRFVAGDRSVSELEILALVVLEAQARRDGLAA